MVARPTPYPAVNEVLNLMLGRASAILGPQMVGMYLYGSLSSGDFDPASSDIDFVVVTETILEQEVISALEKMHTDLWASGLKWAAKLEGSYIPRNLIRRHDPDGPPCPSVNEGEFFVDRRGSDWIIQRHVIRECGVILSGPDPKTLIDPVSAAEIRQSVRGVLEEWWFPMLENPDWLSKHGSEYHAYAVISLCRALHALRHGIIVSKPVAAKWAQTEFGEWSALIEKALAAQAGSQPGFLEEALGFLRFTKALIGNQQ
jgi:predicted nucleotidyltransferase